MYDDQLLQQESSLNLEEIQKYNDAKRKEREEMERRKWEREEAEKPRCVKLIIVEVKSELWYQLYVYKSPVVTVQTYCYRLGVLSADSTDLVTSCWASCERPASHP